MNYDKTDPISIETFGKRLIDKTLATVVGEKEIPAEELSKLTSGRTRGNFGNIVETLYYGINPGSESVPDFEEAGVELKTTPIKKLTSGLYSAKERLVLGMIDYIEESNKTFETSHLMFKNSKLMVVSYLHEEGVTIGNAKIKLAKLYDFEKFPEEDKRIIREDWQIINAKLQEGKAHELSEGDTLYLGACTKSATAQNRRSQIGEIPAKPRAYSYKSGYMTQLARREMGIVDEDSEKIINEEDINKAETFEEQVVSKFKPFIGKTTEQIEDVLGYDLNTASKQYFATLSARMMGVKKGKIEEFESAGIKMKTVQLKQSGIPKEDMSFPNFKYAELIKEKWDADEDLGESPALIQQYLESRFLFVVFECENNCKKREERKLKQVFFWSVPHADRMEAKKVWEQTIDLINKGKIVESVSYNKKGEKIRKTFFPTSTDTSVTHVRPHGQNSDDTYPLPVPDRYTGENAYTKHCFWFNKGYVQKVIEKQVQNAKSVVSPYIEDIKTVKVPLYDSIGCGDMMTADSTVHEFIEVDEKLMSKGSKYFVLRTAGDSMNERGVNEGDLVLCRKDYHPDDGNIVVALIGEDATLKKYHREKDAVVLSPCSTNAVHKEVRFYEGDELKVQGVMIQVLESE